MKVVVSGGSGFVGRFIVEHLLARGHVVAVAGRARPSPGILPGDVPWREATLDPDRDQRALFQGADAFVHAAFDHLPGRYRGGEGADPRGFLRRNLEGSISLFSQAKAAGVRRVVFLSSRAAYGHQTPGRALTEGTVAVPDTLYGEVKLGAEAGLRALRGDAFHGVSLRVTGVYGRAGPGRAHKWSDLFRDWMAGLAIPPRVATEVHGNDVAAAVRLVLEMPIGLATRDLFNVSDFALDRHDLLSLVRAITGLPHPPPPRADAAVLNRPDTARLRALGWRPGGFALLERTVSELLAEAVDPDPAGRRSAAYGTR